MSKKPEKDEARRANTEPLVEPEISDENQNDTADYTDNRVVRLSVPKFGTYMATEETGPAGEGILAEARKLVRTVDASSAPLPLEFVFKADASTVFFGERFETKKDISNEDATLGVLAVMAHYGISCLAVLRDVDHAQVMYGRGDTFEFMKYLPLESERGAE